jgi:hypothetical protein
LETKLGKLDGPHERERTALSKKRVEGDGPLHEGIFEHRPRECMSAPAWMGPTITGITGDQGALLKRGGVGLQWATIG